MKLRATCNVVFDFESDLPYDEAVLLARRHLDSIKFDNQLSDLRVVLQVDKLKDKSERVRLGEVSPEEVFPFVTGAKGKREYEIGGCKYSVRMNSDRYLLFKANSRCVCCSLEGTRMFLECYESDRVPHFNLYGDLEGRLVLFTKDHIQARAFGGKDCLENYQTMCAICNSLKAHSNLTIESLRRLRKIYDDNKKSLTKKRLHLLIEDERKSLEVPWSSQVVTADAGSCELLVETAVIERDKSLIGVPLDVAGNTKVIAFVKKGSRLEPIVEINGYYWFPLSQDRSFSLEKSLVKNK